MNGMRRSALLLTTALVGFACFGAPSGAYAADPTYQFDIPAESLAKALNDFSQASSQQIIFSNEAVAGRKSAGLHGSFTVAQALNALLAGTDLVAATNASGVLMVHPKKEQAASEEGAAKARSVEEAAQPSVAETVTVTGTRIAGVQPAGSPIAVYSRADFAQSGAATIDQFARTIPGNFSDIDTVSNFPSNAKYGAFASSTSNIFEGASFDLHGVGPSATLTLLDGQRLAAGGQDGSLTDISMIPLSAVDHIEVLDDGASSIYGADAVVGVVNIVTRKNFDGAESSFQYGGATSGGAVEETAAQLFGHTWENGDVLVDYEFDNQDGLMASDRNYIPSLGGPNSLIPTSQRNTVFVSGDQSFGSGTTVSWNGLYSNRNFSEVSSADSPLLGISTISNNRGTVTLLGGWVTLDRTLFGDWHGDVTANYSQTTQSWSEDEAIHVGSISEESDSYKSIPTSLLEFDGSANGSLFSLPGGDVKASVGTSYRREGFSEVYTQETGGASSAESQVPSLSRHVTSIFGEVFLPIVEADNGIAWVRRLEISASGRYDDYSDFGSTTNPKVGVLWEFLPGVDARGSYGTAFRAPYLSQLGAAVTSDTLPAPDPTSSNGVTDMLLVQGGNPNLRPETSRAFSGGFDVRPDWLPNLKITATYYDVDFSERIAVPPVIGKGWLTTPSDAIFVDRNPPLSVVQSYFASPGFRGDTGAGTGPGHGSGPSAVTAIFYGWYTNLAATSTSGVELTGSYDFDTDYGLLNMSSAWDYGIEDQLQPSSASASTELLNTYAEPTMWKSRSSLTWKDEGWLASLTLNFVGGYTNTLFTPSQPISSWTTADLNVSYNTRKNPSSTFLQDLTISLNVLNFTDARPPYAPLSPADVLPGGASLPYDPANASPVGRFISIRLTKAW
jgi:iron complex outermembrane recepter protein